MTKFIKTLIGIATAEIGVHEDNGSNTGKRVDEYKAATNLPPHESWAWCAAFVDWCVMRAMQELGISETPGFKRPVTAGAWDLERWSREQDDTTQTKRSPGDDVKAGDILIYNFSHVGIAVEDADPRDGTVTAVEGNTDVGGSRDGGGVFRKTRRLSQIKARIRFRLE